jgi:hypothetical protein
MRILKLSILLAVLLGAVGSLSTSAHAWGCREFGQQGGTGCNSSIAVTPPSYQGPGDLTLSAGTPTAWGNCAMAARARLG